MTGVTDAYGNITRYEYTLTGQFAKVTDALGNETEYTYDLNDRLAEIRQYGAAEKENEADEKTGMDTELMEAQNLNRQNRPCHVTRYQRNALGQVEAITDALGNTEHYTYDKKGQLLEKLDKEGYLTKYGYTAHGDVDHVTYADGREVKLSYNPLRQLEEMEDWLGITRIENDPMGRALKVQYPDGKEVSYTYGKGGERTGITYPDGRTASYLYDSRLRLAGLKDGEDTISYGYDEKGRLSRKTFPNGMETTYAYDIRGQLMELTHRDKEGILDRYVYGYDLMGNKTSIEKQRRGLPEESGAYAYRYDAMGRLAGVSKDGQTLRTYEYDAFGNRSLLKEGSRETAYIYNAMNQLIQKTDVMNEETYAYDKRGNLSLILENGDIKNQYLYGALDRLEQVVTGKGEAAAYEYNGLGHRVGKASGAMEGMAGMQNGPSDAILKGTDVKDPLGRLKEQTINPVIKIEYIIDLTRGYHNLLQKEEEGNTQNYLWDGNVAGIREDRGTASHYYFQDELGSPIRLMDQNGELAESYGYDEFGQELYWDREKTAGRSMTGSIQPFGYTGYQYDRTAGTYYAQAREYRAELGRFAAVDTIKGFTAAPYTLNEYGYCWGNPEKYVDNNGKWATIVIGAIAGALIGGGASIISDVVAGNDINWKDAAIGAGAGAIAGAAIGTGIPAVAVPGTAIGIAGITYAATDDCVVTVGVSANASAGFGACGSSQIAFDKNGNSDAQATAGYALSTQEKVALTGTISIYPGMKDVSESRDYFSVLGISGGLGIFGGIDIMFAGEGNETHPVGVSFSLGVGEGLEAHFNSTYTWRLLEWRNAEMCIE